ncbi:hypothetical protein B7494_g4269 [Chlorociboria aeruginascens]|nr:hypothetical protein B7494_g4269 [Chlorociboria aeruginascens]
MEDKTTKAAPSTKKPKTMAAAFVGLLNSAKQTITGATPHPIAGLFPKVDPEIDGEDCDHDCESCVVSYPKGFKINDDDQLYGHVNGWSTHVLVATSKSDWVRDVGNEKGSVMQAIDHCGVKPNNGKLMLSASNIPTPSHTSNYSEPTTVLLLPAFVIIENVTPQTVPALITEFVNKGPTNTTPLGPISVPASLPAHLPTAEQLTSRACPHRALILLCSQKTRDARCGQSAPLLRKELERHLRPMGLFRDLDDERPGGVGIYFISHVGGHKYSANVMIYRKADAFGLDSLERAKLDGKVGPMPSKFVPGERQEEGAAQCLWIARVRPGDCENIVKFTVLQGKLVKPESQLRGGFDRQKGVYSCFPTTDVFHHKRAKSSVLKSFMHKRTPSTGETLSSTPTENVFHGDPKFESALPMPFLPLDHPHSRALEELQHNQQTSSAAPKKSREGRRPNTGNNAPKTLHKKALSSISLKSLSGKDADKVSKAKESRSDKPKKTKSSTNLAALLSRPKSSRSVRKEEAEEEAPTKDKENRTPISSPIEIVRAPPIYAQFSSEYFAKQPLGGKFLEDEIELYTPRDYSPGKQRNFYHGPESRPTLTRREDMSQLPRTYLPSSFSLQDISRRISSGSSRASSDLVRRVSNSRKPSLERRSTDHSTKSEKLVTNRGQRVMAAVSALGGRTKVPEVDPEPVLEDRDVDTEFEAMLDRRNIPDHQRGKMRSLAVSVKKDFVKQDWAEVAAAKNKRPGTNSSDSSADAAVDVPEIKSKRPRSLTFTLSRKSSKEAVSQKKTKADATLNRHSRTKSADTTNEGSKSLTSSGASVAQNFIAKAKGQHPDDFVAYLRKTQKPELVEVGKLHKLRLLLRNETVAWTDGFIGQGGMEEIVGLLHRTMEVEWREEHEDALLHEVLLCLKALSTTGLALQHINNIQSTLFPALLHMLFDKEKKGPSEFTTRNIISSLLFTYLKSAPLSDRTNRAKTLLSYLRDPEPTESQRPVGFVLEMRRERPYRVWCKETVNVTKEVFWIFLHNLNVIALPGGSPHISNFSTKHDTATSTLSSTTSNSSFDAYNPHHVYMQKHFPQELPPVPAAPYVGGVEWDATNYLASHLDILNGIIACLPTQPERNMLREQLRVSGWERCMGGTLRLCKEKFYGGVHAGLRCWVAAAAEDNWDTRDVRCGPATEPRSPVKGSPKKGPVEAAPKIEMKLDFGEKKAKSEDVWL